MNLQLLTKQIAKIARIAATAIFCFSAIAFIWQGGFFNNSSAIAATANPNLIASDIGREIKQKTSEDAQSEKGFIRDAANAVESTANKNANRIERATDTNGNFLERKANKDAATIQKRAEEDAARTQNAVDATKNAVKDAVDNIKEAF